MVAGPQLQPLVVIVLDGWGISMNKEGNAIAQAETPFLDGAALHYPIAALQASGVEVGLPWGEVGNSETGHRTIGAGKVYYQPRPRIDQTIADGLFQGNPVLLGAIAHAQKNQSSLHIMGLVSTGGVHAHVSHAIELLKMAAEKGLKEKTFLHVFTDGRDTPPQSALTYLDQLEAAMKDLKCGKIASVTGRFYAMDRNSNWERTEQTYNMLVKGERERGASNPRQAIESSYAAGVNDEMILPTPITEAGEPLGMIRDGDAVLFFNYRPDRARQLTAAFSDPAFAAFDTVPLNDLYFATMTQYDARLPAAAAFIEPPEEYPLARVLSDAQLTQLHIAETEKYAHMTYYLNGGTEQPWPGEEHALVESGAAVNFADQPKMHAAEITERIVAEIESSAYNVYFANLANGDMVGHTGNFEAAVEACTFVDQCLATIWQATLQQGGRLMIAADHGNAEEMLSGEGVMEKDHTSNPVPIYLLDEKRKRSTPRSEAEIKQRFTQPIGMLADIAPTILELMEIRKPLTMTGISLLGSLQ